jgi:transposase
LALSLPEKRTREQTQELTRIASLHAEIENALTLAQVFVKMLREQDVQALPAWLTFAQVSSVPELRQFAQGIERDRAAVEAALSRPESNGPVEGLITKLKFIKRIVSWGFSFSFGEAGLKRAQSLKQRRPLTYVLP